MIIITSKVALFYLNTPNRRRLILTRLFPSSLSSLLAGCQDQDGRRRQCSNPSLLQGQCLREEYGQPAQRGDVHRQRHHEAAQSGVGDGEDRQGKTHRVLNYRSIANKPPSIPPPQLFDMKKFQSNVNRELRRAYPDRRRLETQCLSAVAFVKSENDILDCPMWVLIVNVVAMDMLKSKLPPGKSSRESSFQSKSSSLAHQIITYKLINRGELRKRDPLKSMIVIVGGQSTIEWVYNETAVITP